MIQWIQRNGSLIGAIALLLIGRIFLFAPALILFTALSLFYIRNGSIWKRSAILYLLSVLVIIFSFKGIADHMFSSLLSFFIVMSVSTAIGLLPLVVDALLFKKRATIGTLFIYPSVKVLLEFFSSSNSPFGIWGSTAALMTNWYPFNGVVSVTGIWGLSFLAALSSVCIANFLTGGVKSPYNRWSLAICLTGWSMAALIGMIRGKNQNAVFVKVAAILSADSLRLPGVNSVYNHLRSQSKTDLDTNFLKSSFERSNNDLIEKTDSAAGRGAKIIVWAEGNGVVMKSQEKGLLNQVSQICKKRGVYIGIAMEVYSLNEPKPVTNKIVLITPKGTVGLIYQKHHPLGEEKMLMHVGPGTIPTLETPYGKIAAVICYDTDFINYALQVGKQKADILLAPSNDWSEIAVIRGRITQYRSLENGVNLIRPTSHGVTEMISPNGEILSQNNFYKDPLEIIYGEIPIKGKPTIYAEYGNWFPLLLIILVTGIIIWQIKPSIQKPLSLLLLLPIYLNTYSQEPKYDSTLKKTSLLILPAISYAPETNLALGVSLLHINNRNNSLYSFNSLYTFRNQFINEFSNWTLVNKNQFLLRSSLSYNNFPERFYGIGNSNINDHYAIVSVETIKIDASILKKIANRLYVGINYQYGQFTANSDTSFFKYQSEHHSNRSGIGLHFIKDTRDSRTRSSHGSYLDFSILWNDQKWGSTKNFLRLNLDGRWFHTLRKKSILAFQVVMQSNSADLPACQLAYLGSASMMRGFYAGRYRDNNLLAYQLEWRKNLIGKWGLVLFAGKGKVSNKWSELDLKEWHRSIGTGLRRRLDKEGKISLRIDYARGDHDSNFYINILEAF